MERPWRRRRPRAPVIILVPVILLADISRLFVVASYELWELNVDPGSKATVLSDQMGFACRTPCWYPS